MPLQPSHHANSTLIGRFHLMNNFLQTSFREISGISGQTFFTGEGKKRPNHKCPLACKCCTSDDPCRMSNLRSSDFDTNSFSPTSFIFLCSQRRAKTQHSSIHSGERRPSIPLGISGQTFFTGEGKKRPNHKCPLACKCCTSDDPCRMSNLRTSDFDINSFSPTPFIFLCSQRRAKTLKVVKSQAVLNPPHGSR